MQERILFLEKKVHPKTTEQDFPNELSILNMPPDLGMGSDLKQCAKKAKTRKSVPRRSTGRKSNQ